MKRLIVAILVLLAAGAVAWQGGVFSSLDTTCEGEALNINNQTFSSMEEAREVVENNVGVSFDKFSDRYDVCMNNGEVYWNPSAEGS